jgi:hypothetical protein
MLVTNEAVVDIDRKLVRTTHYRQPHSIKSPIRAVVNLIAISLLFNPSSS